MTDDDFTFSEEPPRNERGEPIHPEHGYPICAATKSPRSTPAPHGRSRDDVDYCLQRAGWGTDRDCGPCRNHPITGEQWGESNPNFKNGATSEYFKSKLSDRQQDVFDEWVETLDDPEEAVNLLGYVGHNLILKGESAHDPAMIREGRQMLSEFNVVPNADQVEVEASVEQTTEHELGEDEKAIARDYLKARHERAAEDSRDESQ
jgi:hypothetical protein